MSNVVIRPGVVLQLPEEEREAAKVLTEQLRASVDGVALAQRLYSKSLKELYEFYCSVVPELEGWEFAVNHDTTDMRVIKRSSDDD